jgi:hypothetical protein
LRRCVCCGASTPTQSMCACWGHWMVYPTAFQVLHSARTRTKAALAAAEARGTRLGATRKRASTPLQQLRQFGNLDGDAPRLIAGERVHGLARPVAALSLNTDYLCRVLAIGLKCSSICSSLTGFSNITTPSSKAGAGDSIDPESIITGMPSCRSCAINV